MIEQTERGKVVGKIVKCANKSVNAATVSKSIQDYLDREAKEWSSYHQSCLLMPNGSASNWLKSVVHYPVNWICYTFTLFVSDF